MSQVDQEINRLYSELEGSRKHSRNLSRQISSLVQEVQERDKRYNQLLSGIAQQQSDDRDEQLRGLSQSVGQSHYSRSQIHKTRDQQARQLEEQLRTHINQIVDEIVSGKTSDISLLERQYSQEVEHTIRGAVHNAYSVGVEYVGQIKKRPHHMFITATDIEHIKRLTAEYTHIFWRRMALVLHQQDTVQNMKSSRFSPRSKLSLNNLISSLATKIITKSIASATIVKTNALSTIPPSIRQAQFVDVLVWSTVMDERTCPLCASLDGKEWAYNDPNMLVPPDDTHNSCRCSLDLKDITDTTM